MLGPVSAPNAGKAAASRPAETKAAIHAPAARAAKERREAGRSFGMRMGVETGAETPEARENFPSTRFPHAIQLLFGPVHAMLWPNEPHDQSTSKVLPARDQRGFG
jgi:hypothetical protein